MLYVPGPRSGRMISPSDGVSNQETGGLDSADFGPQVRAKVFAGQPDVDARLPALHDAFGVTDVIRMGGGRNSA